MKDAMCSSGETAGMIGKAWSIYRTAGYRSLIRRGNERLRRTLLVTNSAYWFAFFTGRGDELPGEDSPRTDVTIEMSSPEETIRWIQYCGEQWMYKEKEISTGREEAHLYPHIKADGKIIGYAKVGLGRVYIEDYDTIVTLPAQHAFIYDTFVDPQYRGKKIAPFLVRTIIRYLKTRGIISFGCHIPSWNKASMSVYEGIGFRRMKYVRHVRAFGVKLYFERYFC